MKSLCFWFSFCFCSRILASWLPHLTLVPTMHLSRSTCTRGFQGATPTRSTTNSAAAEGPSVWPLPHGTTEMLEWSWEEGVGRSMEVGGLISRDCMPPLAEGPGLWPLASSGHEARLASLSILWVIPLQSFFSSIFPFFPVRQVLAFHGEHTRLTFLAKHWFRMRPGRLSWALHLYQSDQFMHMCDGEWELL